MPAWIDLFDGPAGNIAADSVPGEPFIKPTVHEWQLFGMPGLGITRVSGTGGVDRLQPLSENAFAGFGGREHKWDAGVIRFTVGNALEDIMVPDGTRFGVHFNTNPNPEGVSSPGKGDNTGYAVLVEKDSFDVHTVNIYRIHEGVETAIGVAPVEPGDGIDPGDEVTVVPGDTIEVRWGYAAITGMDHEGKDWGIKVFIGDSDQPETDAVLVYNDFDPDPGGSDTDAHVSGGHVGVCMWEKDVITSSGFNFLTQFEFQDLLKRISDPALLGTPYKSGPNMPQFIFGLYTDRSDDAPSTTLGGTPTNDTPEDYAMLRRFKAADITPIALEGSDQAMIGFVSIGLSNTGQMWSPFARMVNDPAFMHQEFGIVRNPLVRVVNGAKAETDATEWAKKNHPVWPEVSDKLTGAGLITETEVGKDQRFEWTQEQVQVVWLNCGIPLNSNKLPPEEPGGVPYNEFARFPDAANELRDRLGDILDLLKERFPNLKLVYCSDFNYMGWIALYNRRNSEPVMAETMHYGYKQFIDNQYLAWINAGRRLGTDVPWVGWLTELWNNSDVWLEKFFPPDDNTHPSAAGEEFGARRLIEALNDSAEAPNWWEGLPTSEHTLVSMAAQDDAWVRNDLVSSPLPETPGATLTLNARRVPEEATKHRVYLKFNLATTVGKIQQAYLQLSLFGAKSSFGLPFSVRRVSNDWSSDGLTFKNAPVRLFPDEVFAATPATTSTTHAATVDVTELLMLDADDVISFELEPDFVENAKVDNDYNWYSSEDDETTPNRGPQLILVVDDPSGSGMPAGLQILKERGDVYAVMER